MDIPSTVTHLIDLWPTRRDLASDIAVMPDRVHKWAKANAIPAKFHLRIVRAAERRQFPITPELLVRLHHAEALDASEAA
jgi:hypothetical protein